MSKHGDSLLQEIHDDPSADPPRLVYADHLEQEGDLARATLVRHQVRQASLPWWDAQALELELKIRALLDQHELTWRAKLPVLDHVKWGRFSRGFVGSVELEELAAFEQIDEIRAASPINEVRLQWEPELPKLAAIDTIDHLTFTGTVMRPEDLKWLAGCPLLASIKTLDFVDAALRNGWPHLLKSKHLGKLAALRIPEHHLGNAGLKKLVATTLPSLVELDLTCGEGGASGYGSGRQYASPVINSKGILEFAAWPGLAKITKLDLSGSKLGAEGLLMLLSSPHTKALKSLAIRGIKDSDWDMDDSLGAFKSGPYGTLDELEISDNDLDPEAAHHMAESKALRELKVLRMSNVKSNSFERLAQASWTRSLRVLECGPVALQQFLKRNLEQLHTIVISASQLPLSKIVPLLAKPLPSLTWLELSEVTIDDEGLKLLGSLKLDTLRMITLPTSRDSAALRAFAASKLYAQLASFDCGVPDLDRLPPPPEYVERDDI